MVAEVPVTLSVVKIVNSSRLCYDSGAAVKQREILDSSVGSRS
jgi:hypothetical protein